MGESKLTEEQRELFTDFLYECLVINPRKRAFPFDILRHPWMKGATCCCGDECKCEDW